MAEQAIGRWLIKADTMLFYADGGDYTGPAFDGWCDAIAKGGFKYYIGATGGHFNVSGSERSRAAKLFSRSGVPFAVVTDSVLVRGFTTALGWLGVRTAAFSWNDAASAARWLGHREAVAAELESALSDLRKVVDAELYSQRALKRSTG